MTSVKYKINSAEELVDLVEKGVPKWSPDLVNPGIALDPFWDEDSNFETIKKIMLTLTASRLRETSGPFYLEFFSHPYVQKKLSGWGIEQTEILPEHLFELVIQKDSGRYGAGIRTIEEKLVNHGEQGFALNELGAEHIGEAAIAMNSGSSGGTRFKMPYTEQDLLWEHYSMARIFKRIFGDRKIVGLNLYNPETVGYNTFEGAIDVLGGIQYNNESKKSVDELVDQIITSGSTDKKINLLMGVPLGNGDPTNAKGMKVEYLVEKLIEKNYFDLFTKENPFVVYGVGAALSDDLIEKSRKIPGLVALNAYGLQEGRPLASAFPNIGTDGSQMVVTPMPYLVLTGKFEDGKFIEDNTPGSSQEIFMLSPFKHGSPFASFYMTGDKTFIGREKHIQGIYRVDEDLSNVGCRVG